MKVIETRNEITNPVFEIEKTKDDSNNNDIIVDSKKKKPIARQKIEEFIISDKDISFLKLVGCRGIIILFGITVLVGMHLYAFSVYTQTRYIPILAFFMISAIFNCIVILFLLCTWRVTAKKQIKKNTTPRVRRRKQMSILECRKQYLKNFGLNGRFYLFKLYASELVEKIVQTYNFFTIYTCKYI